MPRPAEHGNAEKASVGKGSQIEYRDTRIFVVHLAASLYAFGL